MEAAKKPPMPKIWDLPGHGSYVTVARLGVTGERSDRWGWVQMTPAGMGLWAQSKAKPALVVDAFGRLWVRGAARVVRCGTDSAPSGPLPPDSAFVRWEYPEGGPDRVLSLFVPSTAIRYIALTESDPSGYAYPVRRIISSVESIPTVARPQ